MHDFILDILHEFFVLIKHFCLQKISDKVLMSIKSNFFRETGNKNNAISVISLNLLQTTI